LWWKRFWKTLKALKQCLSVKGGKRRKSGILVCYEELPFLEKFSDKYSNFTISSE